MGKIEAIHSPKERHIESLLLNYLVHARKEFAWKNPSAGYFDVTKQRFRKHTSPFVRRGVPDILWIRKGRLIGLEVKSITGRQTREQKQFGEDMWRSGAAYFIVRSLEELNAIERALDEARI